MKLLNGTYTGSKVSIRGLNRDLRRAVLLPAGLERHKFRLAADSKFCKALVSKDAGMIARRAFLAGLTREEVLKLVPDDDIVRREDEYTRSTREKFQAKERGTRLKSKRNVLYEELLAKLALSHPAGVSLNDLCQHVGASGQTDINRVKQSITRLTKHKEVSVIRTSRGRYALASKADLQAVADRQNDIDAARFRSRLFRPRDSMIIPSMNGSNRELLLSERVLKNDSGGQDLRITPAHVLRHRGKEEFLRRYTDYVDVDWSGIKIGSDGRWYHDPNTYVRPELPDASTVASSSDENVAMFFMVLINQKILESPVPVAGVYDLYHKWCEQENLAGVNLKRFGMMARAMGIRSRQSKIAGKNTKVYQCQSIGDR